MAADEVFFHTECDDLFVDGRFNTAHIREDAVFIYDSLKLCQISGVAGDRRAQEDIAAASEMFVDGSAGRIDRIVLYGKRQRFPAFVKCDDLMIRIIFPDGFGNRTADQAQPDKSDLYRIHISQNPFSVFPCFYGKNQN